MVQKLFQPRQCPGIDEQSSVSYEQREVVCLRELSTGDGTCDTDTEDQPIVLSLGDLNADECAAVALNHRGRACCNFNGDVCHSCAAGSAHYVVLYVAQ